MEEIVNLLVQNGLGVCCVAYLIYFQHYTMTKMLETLTGIDKRLALIENKLKVEEDV